MEALQWDPTLEQDAQEVMHELLKRLGDCTVSIKTAIQALFGGLLHGMSPAVSVLFDLIDCILCNCGYEAQQNVEFLDVSLAIVAANGYPIESLEESLNGFVATYQLDDGNLFRCPNCKYEVI